jgi:hypothetical protein
VSQEHEPELLGMGLPRLKGYLHARKKLQKDTNARFFRVVIVASASLVADANNDLGGIDPLAVTHGRQIWSPCYQRFSVNILC